jgi:ABC-type multidrug transport system fused ATPase/permease subunit
LDSVSLNISSSQSVALVGSTGAGKSTLADVILGVLLPDSGSVLISGVQPFESVQQWPGAMAYVPQDVAVLTGSVRENVALGIPSEFIDDSLVWGALERAHLADFLRSSRDGIETLVGENGVQLSGGQRQRLGIARALYSRPRLLVLDEATSALDAETERLVTETLDSLAGEVTLIIIAHRLATVRHCDQVIYLADGRITGSGTFSEVRAQVPDFDRQAQLLGL